MVLPGSWRKKEEVVDDESEFRIVHSRVRQKQRHALLSKSKTSFNDSGHVMLKNSKFSSSSSASKKMRPHAPSKRFLFLPFFCISPTAALLLLSCCFMLLQLSHQLHFSLVSRITAFTISRSLLKFDWSQPANRKMTPRISKSHNMNRTLLILFVSAAMLLSFQFVHAGYLKTQPISSSSSAPRGFFGSSLQRRLESSSVVDIDVYDGDSEVDASSSHRSISNNRLQVGSDYFLETKIPVIGVQTFRLRILDHNLAELTIEGLIEVRDKIPYQVDQQSGELSFTLSESTKLILKRFRTKLLKASYCPMKDRPSILVRPPLPMPIHLHLARK